MLLILTTISEAEFGKQILLRGIVFLKELHTDS